jgi:dUTP pyrophosphatase
MNFPSTNILVKIKRLNNGLDLPLPKYETKSSVGMDLYAAVSEPVRIDACSSMVIPCGFALEIPAGFEVQIRSRSGLAAKRKISVLNSPGTIDPDYRGEICVILMNHRLVSDFKVERGDRIAQMVLCKAPYMELVKVDRLSDTDRGSGGFGSTGVKPLARDPRTGERIRQKYD